MSPQHKIKCCVNEVKLMGVLVLDLTNVVHITLTTMHCTNAKGFMTKFLQWSYNFYLAGEELICNFTIFLSWSWLLLKEMSSCYPVIV